MGCSSQLVILTTVAGQYASSKYMLQLDPGDYLYHPLSATPARGNQRVYDAICPDTTIQIMGFPADAGFTD
jgi:hypothetical protein